MAYIYVFIGGGIGSALRFWIGQRYNQDQWPIGTFVANIIACVVLGIVMQRFHSQDNHYMKWLLAAGFCGGLSTFSTLIFELTNFVSQGKLAYGIGYVILSILISIPCLLLGYKL